MEPNVKWWQFWHDDATWKQTLLGAAAFAVVTVIVQLLAVILLVGLLMWIWG